MEYLAQGKCERIRKRTGEYLFRRGDESTAVYILLSGEVRAGFFCAPPRAYSIRRHAFYLSIITRRRICTRPTSLATLRSSAARYTTCLCPLRSRFQDQPNDVRCLTRCTFFVVPKYVLVELTEQRRLVLLDFIRPMIENISLHLKELEFPYEYFLLRNGEHLHVPNDPSDSFYFLINGRLREHRKTAAGKAITVREYSKVGATIGIARLLLGAPHTTYTTAVRDTELVRFDKAWITQLMRTVRACVLRGGLKPAESSWRAKPHPRLTHARGPAQASRTCPLTCARSCRVEAAYGCCAAVRVRSVCRTTMCI